MSPSFDPPGKPAAEVDNPYGSPLTTTNRFGDRIDQSVQYPPFCLVVFIIALLLTLLRGLVLVFSVIGAATIGAGDPIAATAWAEVATSAIIFVGGMVGYIAMLARQRWGSWFGWLCLAGVIGSIAVAVVQLALTLPDQPGVDQPGFMLGIWVGFGFFALMRLAIAVLCGVAIVKFVKWYDSARA